MDELTTQQGAVGPAPAGPSGLQEDPILDALRRHAAGLPVETQPVEAPDSGLLALREREEIARRERERLAKEAEAAANRPGWLRGTLDKLGGMVDSVKRDWEEIHAPEGFKPQPDQPVAPMPPAVLPPEPGMPVPEAMPPLDMGPQLGAPLPEALTPSLPTEFAVTPEEIAAQEAEANRVAQMVEAQSQLAAIEPRAIGRLQTAVGEGPVQFAPEPGMLIERNRLIEQAGFTPEQMATDPLLPGVGVTEAREDVPGIREGLTTLQRQNFEEIGHLTPFQQATHLSEAVAKQMPPAIVRTLGAMLEGAARIGRVIGDKPGDALAMARGLPVPPNESDPLADGIAFGTEWILEQYPWTEPENAREIAAAGVNRMTAEMYTFMTAGRSFAAKRGVDLAKLRGVGGAARNIAYYGPLDAAIGAANPENSSLGALEPLVGDIPGFDADNTTHRAAFEVITGGSFDVVFGLIGDGARLARQNYLDIIVRGEWKEAAIIDAKVNLLQDIADASADLPNVQKQEIVLALPPGDQPAMNRLLGPGVEARDLPEGLPRVETVSEGRAPRTIGEEPIPPRELIDPETGQVRLDVREDVPTAGEVGRAGADRFAAEDAAREARLRDALLAQEGDLPTATQAGYRRSGETLEEFGREVEVERAEFEAQQDLERRTAGPTKVESEKIRLQRDLRGRAEGMESYRSDYIRVREAEGDELREIVDAIDIVEGQEVPMHSQYARIIAQQKLDGREVFTPEYVAASRAFDEAHRGAGLERRRTLGGDITDRGPVPDTPEAVRAAGDDLVSEVTDLEHPRAANLAAEQGQAGIEATRVLNDTEDLYDRLAQGNPALAPYARDPVRGLLFAAGAGAAMLAAESEGADGETLAMLGIFGISGANPKAIRRMAINGLGVQAAAHLAEGVTQASWARQMSARYGADFTEEIADAAWAHGHIVLDKLRLRSEGLIDRMVDIDDTAAVREMLEGALEPRETFINRLLNRPVERGTGFLTPDAGSRDVIKFVVKPTKWYKRNLRYLSKFFGNERDADLYLRFYSTLSPQRDAATSNVTLAIQAFNSYKRAAANGTLLVDGNVDPSLFKGIGTGRQAQELADAVQGLPTVTVKRADFTGGLRRGAGEPQPVARVAEEVAEEVTELTEKSIKNGPSAAAQRELDDLMGMAIGRDLDRNKVLNYLSQELEGKQKITKREVEELTETLVRDLSTPGRFNVSEQLRRAPAPLKGAGAPLVGDAAVGRVVADVWLARMFGLADRSGADVFDFKGATKTEVVAALEAAGWTRQEARDFVIGKVNGEAAVLPKQYATSKATLPQRSAANKFIQGRKGNITAQEYEFISERVRVIAGRYGLDTYEAQAALWAAGKLFEQGSATDIRALHQILSTDPRFRSGMYDPQRGFLVEDLSQARDVARASEAGPIRAPEFEDLREFGALDSGDPAGALVVGARGRRRALMHPALQVGEEIVEAPVHRAKGGEPFRAAHVGALDEADVRGLPRGEVEAGIDGFTGPAGGFFDRKAAIETLQKIGLASAALYAMNSGTFGDPDGDMSAENVMVAMGLGAMPGGARSRVAKIVAGALREFPGEGGRVAGRTLIGAGVGAGISAVTEPERGKAGVLTGAGIGAALGLGTGVATRARLKASRFGDGVKGVGARDLPETPRQAFRQARAAVLDDIEGARKITMEAERVGGRPVDPEMDIEVALRASRAWAPYAEQIMRDGVMAPGEAVSRTKRGLRTIYQDLGTRISDFRDYALARRAQELDARGKGLPEELENYEEVLAGFKGDTEMEEAFTDLQENFRALLDVAEETGLIEPGGAARIGKNNQNYVPFWRDVRTESAKLSGPFRQIIRQIKGSKFAVEDPIVTMVQAQAKFAEAIMRQQSANALWRFGAEYPDASLISRTTDPATARPSDMPRLTGGAEDDLFENLPRAVFDADGAEVTGRVLRIYDQGKAVTFKVNDDLLWDAYVQSPEAASMGVRMGAVASRVLREFVTTEPTFAATNFIRDVGTGVITSKTLTRNPLLRGPQALKDALYGISVALVSREGRDAWRAAEGAMVGGTLGYIAGTDDRASTGAIGAAIGGGFAGLGARGLAKRAAKRAGADSPQDLYRAWVSSGGAQGVVEGFRTRREVMRGMVKDATRRELVPIAHPIRVLQDLNRAVEEGNRLAEWIRLMERNGMDRTHPELMKDAMVTRDLTTDFLRKGGSKTIQAVSMLKAFWNPRVQGYDRLARVFTEAGRGGGDARNMAAAAAATTIGAITVPSLMLAYVNNKYHREEYLRDTTDFDRTFFWLVKNPTGEGFIRIPKPFEMGVLFGSLPERLFENAVFGDDERLEPLTEGGIEEALSAFSSDLIETVSPVPTALDPWAENMTNRDFAGQPVVNPYELLQNKDKPLMDREGASEVGKFIADQLDVPAPQVDNVLTGYTGRVGEEGLRVADQILAAMGESETGQPVAQRPSDSFLGDRFLTDTPRRTTSTTTKFYEQFRDIEQVRNTIADKEGSIAAQRWERDTAEGLRYTELKDAGKEIREMRNMQKQVRDAVTKGDVPWYPEERSEEPLTGEEKRSIIDRLSRLVDEVAFQVLTGEEPEPLEPTQITF